MYKIKIKTNFKHLILGGALKAQSYTTKIGKKKPVYSWFRKHIIHNDCNSFVTVNVTFDIGLHVGGEGTVT